MRNPAVSTEGRVCLLCRGTGWREPKMPGYMESRWACRMCNMLGFVDEQIQVLYQLDKNQAHALAKERREGNKEIRMRMHKW